MARISEIALEFCGRGGKRLRPIDSVKGNLIGQLENTYIVRPDGTKQKVQHK